MAAVVLTWLLLFFMFSGLGLLPLRLLGQAPERLSTLFDSFWLGWALTLGVAQLWHFLLPVNDLFLALLAATAFLLWLRRKSHLVRLLRRLPRDRLYILLLALLALWLANRALAMPTAYDTGFRDMQAVLWLDSFSLTPGLGNLFSSLAMNQSVYLYDALLDAFFWSGRSHHIALGLLLLVYLAYALKALLSICRASQAAGLRWSWIFASVTLPYALYTAVPLSGITHFLTDSIVDIVGFVSMIYFLDFLQDRPADGAHSNYSIYRLAIVILTGFTIKQSFMVFGLAIGASAFLAWLRRQAAPLTAKSLMRALMPVVLVALALLLPWMARGVVSSGYIAYPQTVGRMPVDWAIPVEELRHRQLNMSANTRLRGEERALVLASWQWLGPWLRGFAGNIMTTMLPTLIAAAGLGAALFGAWRSREGKGENRLSPWSLTPLLASILIWFLTFPEPKYARFLLWSLAALSVILALGCWQTLSLARRKALLLALVGICLAYSVYFMARTDAWLLPAGEDQGFHVRPSAAHNEFVTHSGLVVNVPAGPVPQCWRIPLPCTPYPNAMLEARAPGELRHGFRQAAAEPLTSDA